MYVGERKDEDEAAIFKELGAKIRLSFYRVDPGITEISEK